MVTSATTRGSDAADRYDRDVQLFRELGALTRWTGSLWLHYVPYLGFWLLAGHLGFQVLNAAASLLGGAHPIWAFVLFSTGVSLQVVGTIMAILSLKTAMRTPMLLARDPQRLRRLAVPAAVWRIESPLDVALLSIGPIMGAYAAWGVVEQMLGGAGVWMAVFHRLDSSSWWLTQRTDRLLLFAGIAVVALLLRVIFGWLTRREVSPWWLLPQILLECLWTFSGALALLVGAREFGPWFWMTRFGNWLGDTIRDLIGLIPPIPLPFNLTLPELFIEGFNWVWTVLFPAVWQGILWPLIWLAVTAMVFGWRDFRVRDLVGRGGSGDEPATGSRAERFLHLVTTDLREKYLPLLHIIRLVIRSGPYVMGAFLVIHAALVLAEVLVGNQLGFWFAAGTQTQGYVTIALRQILPEVLFKSVFVCLFAATFDRGLADAAGFGEQRQPATQLAGNRQ